MFSRPAQDPQRPPMHRALRQMDLPARRVLVALLLSGGATVALWLALPWILWGWQALMELLLRFCGIDAPVSQTYLPLAGWRISTLSVDFAGGLPDIWQLAAAALVVLALISLARWKGLRFLPAKYLALAIAVILLASMLQLTFAAGTVQRRAGDEATAQLWAGQILLLLLPGLLGCTYFILNDHLPRQLALLAASLVFVLLATPLLAVAHLVVLDTGSLLWSPLLFLLFGSLPMLMGVVAFYGWAMGWE